ncbi:venom serine carboxypeptidase-like [Dermacentor albipictus]|uniref:venom serine carboxypeptidase-like n=1 Tax=Dermacentor albipictus TaxID=60249 RepID=UPI0038FCAD74
MSFSFSSTDSGPLFLTPLIEQKKYDEARAKSRVDLFAKKANAIAHSGFITVNKTLGSNMFFLYVQAQFPENPSTAPLMLWMQGGPGMSSLFGQFLEFGPLALDADGKLYKRLHTMQSDVSVIYLDVPVGAGYSFTKDSSVRSAVAIAYRLLTDQFKHVPLKLQGAALGDGFMGSIFDVADSSEFLHQVSMLTREGGDEFAKQFSTMRSLLTEDKGLEALQMLSQTTFANPTQPTLFQNLTLYNQQASALHPETAAIMIEFYQYANTTGLREAIHVGLDANFQATNEDLLTSLAFDFL